MQGQEVEELCGPKEEEVQEVRRLQVEEQEMQGQEGQAGSPSCPAERRGSVVQ